MPQGISCGILILVCYLFLLAARRRWARSSSRLRMRRFLGVTSKSSSSLRNSRLASRLRTVGGVRRRASSLPEARMLVTCFFLHTFTSKMCIRDRNGGQMPSAVQEMERELNQGAQEEEMDHSIAGMRFCPECGAPVVHEGGCVICRQCGYSKCG